MDLLGEVFPKDRFCEDIPFVYDDEKEIEHLCKCKK
jgi:hypothetical protein